MSCNTPIWDSWCMLRCIFRFPGGHKLRIQWLYTAVIMVQISSHYINYNQLCDTLHPKIKKNLMLQCIPKFLESKCNYLVFNWRFCYRTSATRFALYFALPTKSKSPNPINWPHTHINESKLYQNVHILNNLKKHVHILRTSMSILVVLVVLVLFSVIYSFLFF